MDFSLNDVQKSVRQCFRDFALKDIRPQAEELDEKPRFPRELFEKAGALGFFGMRYPEPEGSGADLLSYLLAVEEMAAASLAVAASCTMQSLMGTYFLQAHGDEKLREDFLRPALRGEKIGTICMTEPDAGSDLFSMTTRARREGELWRITGQKTWITSAPVADFFTVFARTGEKELSIFLVAKGASGLEVGKSIEKMGVRASLTSEVSFDDTPAVALLGEQGAGMDSLRKILSEIRLMTAALSLGLGRAAFEAALDYAKQRRQFGKTLDRFQAVQLHLSEMKLQIESARQLLYWAAWRQEQGLENSNEAALAKLCASEAAAKICDLGSRVMASYGFATEYPMQRYLRDMRFLLIGGGTSEILRLGIARSLTRS
jgi:butyryl-CoA dehydrogenase